MVTGGSAGESILWAVGPQGRAASWSSPATASPLLPSSHKSAQGGSWPGQQLLLLQHHILSFCVTWAQVFNLVELVFSFSNIYLTPVLWGSTEIEAIWSSGNQKGSPLSPSLRAQRHLAACTLASTCSPALCVLNGCPHGVGCFPRIHSGHLPPI